MNPIIIKTDLITPLTQIKSVSPITPVTAILDSQDSSSKFKQGQKYQAFIEARLPNGNSRVLINNKLLQINLPVKFQPGNKLELVFISPQPNLKFLIFDEAITKSKENITSISTTGRFIDVLMHDTLKHASTNITQPLTSSSPILNGIPINSTELPSLLQKTIIQSGLFYESHQAQWINGENTLENLQQEPQGKLLLAMSELSMTKTAISSSPNPEVPAHAQTMSLVQQQLNTLETGHLFWQGEVWHGQLMEWDICEQSKDKSKSGESDHAVQWHTQLHLSLPQLGDITATILINAQGINIKIETSQVDATDLLKSNQSLLTTDMQSAGLTIQKVEVQYNDNE
ncbi:flagellar hook-length control protein FliK [Nitrosomonas ureae]|uniref:Hook-length control protein FliK n=1 Tax=Nitrosomonas ureae TaxID=44577 RepID=A0A1H5VZZ2_9PROT|nr:flagellar hook-length control protein FliK [Nitrosomonas ureae]SEF92441.1 hook-length control protein FliK [Nitrosomonas ureae]